MVIESDASGWGSAARQTLAFIARSVAAAREEKQEVVSLRIAQRMSIALHRETARAILKRCSVEVSEAPPDELPSSAAFS